MKTNKISIKNKTSSRVVSRITLKWIIIGIVTIVVVTQSVFNFVLFNRVIRNGGSDQTIITSLITQAVNGILTPAPIEPQTGNVYFPEAKFYVPASNSFSQLLYNYQPAFEGSPSQMDVTTKQALSAAESRLWSAEANPSSWHLSDNEKLFSQVPSLQVCARGVHIFFDAKTGTDYNFKPQGTRLLNDGRTLYFYTESQPVCQSSFDPLIAQLKEAQSY